MQIKRLSDIWVYLRVSSNRISHRTCDGKAHGETYGASDREAHGEAYGEAYGASDGEAHGETYRASDREAYE